MSRRQFWFEQELNRAPADVEYEDISAAVNARLQAKHAKKQEKSGSKRKHRSSDHTVTNDATPAGKRRKKEPEPAASHIEEDSIFEYVKEPADKSTAVGDQQATVDTSIPPKEGSRNKKARRASESATEPTAPLEPEETTAAHPELAGAAPTSIPKKRKNPNRKERNKRRRLMEEASQL